MTDPAMKTIGVWVENITETLGALLSQEVKSEGEPKASDIPPDELESYIGEAFSLPFTLSGQIAGPAMLALNDDDAKAIASLMLAEEEVTEEFSKLHGEVLAESMNQLASLLPDAIAGTTGVDGCTIIEGTHSHGYLPDLGARLYKGHEIVLESGSSSYRVYLIVPSMLFDELSNAVFMYDEDEVTESPGQTIQPPPQATAQQPDFQPLSASTSSPNQHQDIDRILDVPMQITAVLGTTSINMEDLINMGRGSVLELEKLAGDPIELYVHGRQVAVGEVVVIDEHFGVKILEMTASRNGRTLKSGLQNVV